MEANKVTEDAPVNAPTPDQAETVSASSGLSAKFANLKTKTKVLIGIFAPMVLLVVLGAVVASEIKNLATQTVKATDEIGSQIGGIQVATQKAVEAIGKISKTIVEISENSTAISAAMEEKSATTQEISRNVVEVATGTEEVTTNLTTVNKAAGETGTAASEILESSNGLAEQSEKLSQEVTKFLEDVRAA